MHKGRVLFGAMDEVVVSDPVAGEWQWRCARTLLLNNAPS